MTTELRVHWLSPGDPARRTGGFLFNARMAEELAASGWQSIVHRLDAAWPTPATPPALPDLPVGARVIADGLLLTALSPQLVARTDLAVLALVHSPLWREGCATLRRPEADALAACAGVVATSDATAAELAEDCGRAVHALVPGTDPAEPATAGPGGRLLCPAHLVHRKGHDRLFDALDALPVLPWTLTLVGSRSAEPATAAAVQARAAVFGDRVRIRGAVDAAGMDAALRAADLVVLPSRYEAFGMVLTEAVARGVPVLCTPAGATPLLGDAAVVTPPERLGVELLRWLADPDLRARRRAAALDRAGHLPRWPDQARKLAALLAALPTSS